jgi:hypothetical protein
MRNGREKIEESDAFINPQLMKASLSSIRNPQSAIRNPQSAIV